MSADESARPRQLPLDLPHEPALGRDDFIAGPTNRQAMAAIDAWPAWPERGMMIVGPAGSGKSHLVAIWRGMSGAACIPAALLGEADPSSLIAGGAIAVEDLHAGPIGEEALFHLINAAMEHRIALLLTSQVPVSSLRVGLPDLLSRLRAMHEVALRAPDDDLLRRVLVKLFADRQLHVEPAVVDFILLRIERSLEAVNTVVEELDRQALAENRSITRRLAGEALARLDAHQGSFWPPDARQGPDPA